MPESQTALAAVAFKQALADSGLTRADVDGICINMGFPLGTDYDRFAQAFGLDIRYVSQTWMHGRFVTMPLRHAALAVEAGLADVAACVTAISFTRALPVLGAVDAEDMREEGGTHGESPHYGLTAPASGAALGMQRYMHVHDATSEQLAAVPVAFRKHAALNPAAPMRTPMTVADHQASRFIVGPLHLLDCRLVTDGAVIVLVTSAERAKDLKQKPVRITGMQGLRTGREGALAARAGAPILYR